MLIRVYCHRTPLNPAADFCWRLPLLLCLFLLLSCYNNENVCAFFTEEEDDTVAHVPNAQIRDRNFTFQEPSSFPFAFSKQELWDELWRFSLQRCQSIWITVAPHNSRKWNCGAIIFLCSGCPAGMAADLVKWAICLLKQLDLIDRAVASLMVNICSIQFLLPILKLLRQNRRWRTETKDLYWIIQQNPR